jgi:ParB/RepB/Spo0J family partition protein
MAATAAPATGGLTLPLARIHVPENVRVLNPEHVDALAASIALQGMLVPIVVCPAQAEIASAGFEYELVAGFHRVAAAGKLGLVEAPAVIRDSAGEEADRAVENITRLQLGPAEEAAAVKAMLDKGLTEDGAAQALGWPKARITARIKLLELPEKARELVGTGVIPLSAVDQLRAIGAVSPQLLEVLIDYLDGDPDGHTWATSQLVSDPGRVLGNALHESDSKVFAAYLHQLPSGAVDELRLGKKTTEQLAEAEKLHRQINQYAYGPPPIRFSEQDVDQARAAGVLIELDHSNPIIVDRPLYRELAKGAVKRTVEELREQAERGRAERKQASLRQTGLQPEDPAEDARREHGRRVRQLAEQAHGANLDLGWALMNNLATVNPEDTTVAKFFVYGLLGSDYDGSPYTQSGNLVAELAVRGIRLVIEEFRTDVTKTLKEGSRGKLRIDYGNPKEPEKPIAWLWKFVDGAKTAGDLYGRALVVIAAEQYACRLVVPSSQQFGAKRWPSHRDQAAKALQKLAGPHLPATMKQLERAIAEAGAELRDAQEQARVDSRNPAVATRKASNAEADAGAGEETDSPAEASDQPEQVDDDLIEQLEDGDPSTPAARAGPDGHVYSEAAPGL